MICFLSASKLPLFSEKKRKRNEMVGPNTEKPTAYTNNNTMVVAIFINSLSDTPSILFSHFFRSPAIQTEYHQEEQKEQQPIEDFILNRITEEFSFKKACVDSIRLKKVDIIRCGYFVANTLR
jgi:hypothetical protein